MSAGPDWASGRLLTRDWELKELELLLPQFGWLTSAQPGDSEVSGHGLLSRVSWPGLVYHAINRSQALRTVIRRRFSRVRAGGRTARRPANIQLRRVRPQ